MPDFGPYLIFCLYLSRMQKYAFFSVCANIPRGNPSPARFFLIKRLIKKAKNSRFELLF